ncbi:MAG: DUF6065 family protein [Parvibaculaceae bacterium]
MFHLPLRRVLGRRLRVPAHANAHAVLPPKTIEFLCDPADLGVIAEPVAARSELPDWFRKLPAVDRSVMSATNNGLTVKRCMPFLDAMSLGFILPIAATVRIEVREGGTQVEAGWEFDKVMVSNHGTYQVAGHPLAGRPPMKIHNYWTIRTPMGWSCLFVPPLNRPSLPISVVAGVVDTDRYASLINFPFFAAAEDGVYTLDRGTPLVQVIPFRREDTGLSMAKLAETAVTRGERPKEGELRDSIRRNTLASEGWYRRFARANR